MRTIDECKLALSQHLPVAVALEISLKEWRAAPKGCIPVPNLRVKLVDTHSIVFVGYNDEKAHFIIRNSWGIHWGDKGYGYLPYNYFTAHALESWIGLPGWLPTSPDNKRTIIERVWGVRDCLASTPLHIVDVSNDDNDECIGWAHLVERDGFADIEELFVRPIYRGQGYGYRLAQLIRTSPQVSNRPLRLWISHADQQTLSEPPTWKILQTLGLSATRANQRWAAYVAT